MTTELKHVGSLITTADDQLLGHLMVFKERGTYEPNLGKVDVSEENAKIHNKLLDEALIAGLDDRCEIGQEGMFYLKNMGKMQIVRTWTGLTVSEDVTVAGRRITFRRNGRTFVGNRIKGADCFTFTRTE